MDQQEVVERFAVEELCGADAETFTEAFVEFIQECGDVEPSEFFGPIGTPELFFIALMPLRPALEDETVVAAVREISGCQRAGDSGCCQCSYAISIA
jgi:hypothetical protein